MKKLIYFLKALSFLFGFLLVNSIYSQTPCGGGYSYSYGTYRDCYYWFLKNVPGTPTIDHITWRIGSSGTYGTACDTATIFNGDTAFYNFCFSENHEVAMSIVFTSGSTCSVVQTINVTCSTGIVCDPDPMRIDAIPNPVVEITYMSPFVCLTGQLAPFAACMYTFRGGAYDIGCGWTWALRMPPTGCTPDYWTYYVEYTKVVAGCGQSCDRIILDTTVKCITAEVGAPIYIVATANSCCLPSGYQRGYIWTPSWTTQAPIGAPPTPLGHCSAYYTCPGNSVCNETQYTMSFTSGWPSPPNCFSGGKKIEQRDFIALDNNANIEQNVSIYNIQGMEIFYGKWKFASPDSPILNWPDNIGSGIYFVKFQNSGEKLTKLFKLN